MKVLKALGETSGKDPMQSEKQIRILLPTEYLELTAKTYTALRKLRSNLVKAYPDGVTTAYHIFSNATLQKISKKIPRNKEELLEIDGLGKAKVNKYGDRLLEAVESTINEYYVTNKKESDSME